MNTKPFHITRKFEHKKFSRFQERRTKNSPSYSSFMITSDKKLILCKRSSSFYFSHMISVFKRLLRNDEPLKDNIVKVIVSYIIHFKEYELVTFLLWLNTSYDIFQDITRTELDILNTGIDPIPLQFLNDKILLLVGNPLFILSMKDIASSFVKSVCRGETNMFSHMNNDPVYVLPGGRCSSVDNNIKDTLYREVKEEIGYDMNSNDIKIVLHDFSIVEKSNDLTPVLVCTTTDKVFNRYFVEYISIVFIPTTSQEILNSFRPNKEVSGILLLDVRNEIEKMFADKTATPLLQVFKRL